MWAKIPHKERSNMFVQGKQKFVSVCYTSSLPSDSLKSSQANGRMRSTLSTVVYERGLVLLGLTESHEYQCFCLWKLTF